MEGCDVFALADGAGGVGRGAFAAERVIAHAEAFARGMHGSPSDALRCADEELSEHGCMSTGIIVAVRDGVISGASCGDSVAWLIHGESVLELSEFQFRKPLLGGGGVPICFASMRLVGTLMLASDGLVNYAPRSLILANAGGDSIAHAAIALAELPRLRSGVFPDDVSVVLTR